MTKLFSKLLPRSFRSQLIYGTASILAILIISFTYLTTKQQNDFLREEGLKQAINRSTALAATSKAWIMANDFIGLDEVMNNFSIYENLVFATVINMDGKVLAHTDRSLVGKFIADKDRIDVLQKMQRHTDEDDEKYKVLLQNRQYIDILRVINEKGMNIGLVHLRLDQSIRQKNIDDTIYQGIIFTLVSLFIGVLFSYITANSLLAQLLHLIAVMKQVRQGDKSVQADEDAAKVNELRELSHEFNVMLKELKTSEALGKELQERLELAFIGSHDGIWDWDLINNEVYLSPVWKEMLGYKEEELSNKFSSWEENLHPDDKEKALEGLDTHLDGKAEYYENISRLRHKDGHWVWILARGKALFDENGKAVRMIGTHTDISDEKEMQQKYIHQAQIIEQTHDSVISTDLEGNIINWNFGSQRLFGYKADEVVGKNISLLYPKEDVQVLRDVTSILFATGEFNADVTLLDKSNHSVSVALSVSLLRDEKDNPINIVCYSQDITQRKTAEDKLNRQKDILEYQAHHDGLTQLPNRLLFYDRLSQAIEKAKRNNSNLAIFFIDLDRFKQINDSLGHGLGDEVLQLVASRLLHIIRKEDTLARLGGDEFTILMEDLNHVQDASILAQKILKSLVEPMLISERTLYISSSIGISLYPQDGADPASLLKYADAAMYRAKDEGRDNFQFYLAEMTEKASEHIALETSMRQALNNEEFIVYYQAQTNGLNDKLTGMEALVRWEHPVIGLVSPAKFIPLAEETGLIIPLDQWVMRTAMCQIVQWYKEGLNPGVLALNLAIKQLQQKDFIDILGEMLQETGCRPQWLTLEVTEGQIMTNPEKSIVILRQISDMGIEVAIDDFGTGYSSLSYLKRLPIDKLKIDQSFVQGLPDDEEDLGISRAVISLAQSLKLDVIAEGVETQRQKDFLVESGCINIQGYFYARPMPADKMETVLRGRDLESLIKI